MYAKRLLLFIIITLCYVLSVYAGECTKDDIIKMIDKGFSKQQIKLVCKETLIETDPMCCCEIKESYADRRAIQVLVLLRLGKNMNG